jgi:hypothetical protein
VTALASQELVEPVDVLLLRVGVSNRVPGIEIAGRVILHSIDSANDERSALTAPRCAVMSAVATRVIGTMERPFGAVPERHA